MITGFRFARGGAQEWFGVTPDLTTYAKGLGGGFPVAAIGGTRDAMRLIAEGRLLALGHLQRECGAVRGGCRPPWTCSPSPACYERQRALGYRLADGLAALAAERGPDAYVEGLGTVFQLWFADGPIRNWRDAALRCRRGVVHPVV